MNLKFTHKPNYFLFAELLIKHIEGYIHKHPGSKHAIFDLGDIYQLFGQDYASVTVNLAGILNIADEYKVETRKGDRKIIQHYQLNLEEHKLLVDFDQAALDGLRQGNPPLAPDASIQQ